MRTTTIVREQLAFSYPSLTQAEIVSAESTLELRLVSTAQEFRTLHAFNPELNIIFTDEEPQLRTTTRQWPNLTVAQAWVDMVLSGKLNEGLANPVNIISAQVDPE